MKAAVVLTLVILACGLLAGAHYQNRIATARHHQRVIRQEAVKLGIRSASSADRRITKRDRTSDAPEMRSLAEDFVRLAGELNSSGNAPNREDLIRSLIENLGSLPSGELARVMPSLHDLSDESVKESVVTGIALKDVRFAFSLLEALGFKDRSLAVRSIVEAASLAPDRRDEAIDALRDHLADLPREADRIEMREAGFAALADGIGSDGFHQFTSWLEGKNPSAPELAAFTGGLTFSKTRGETSLWIDWLSDHLPMADLSEPVAELMREWTSNDYIAAGQWLATSPDSPGKLAAVAAYAETVAGTDPHVAVLWAQTLPDTWRRAAVMRAIHEKWPANDPQGAALFAQSQGIK